MKIIRPIPEKVYLACSGGVDSMVVYHFLKAGGRDVTPLYFNHGTEFGEECENFLKSLDIKRQKMAEVLKISGGNADMNF
jgi:tRNA U34 2-thiouridine synthase MnmA/TrmU